MEERQPGVSGLWWRFSDYQIFEVPMPEAVGARFAEHYCYIRPSPNARLETYEPLIGEGDQEHNEQVAYPAIREINLDDEGEILDWCRRFGLLGILPQRAVYIRLAPRWKPLVDARDPCLFPAQVSYSRTNVGWHPVEAATLIHDDSKIIRIDQEDRMEDLLGKLVDPEDTIHLGPSATISRLFSYQYEEKKLGEAIGHFFPDLPYGDWDTPEYPMPLSDAFWRQYGESLGDFRSAILRFREMVENLSPLKASLKHLREEDLRRLGQARSQLHSLLSVSPALGIDEDGNPVHRWAFSSLLSMFALSVWQDLVGGKSVRHCARHRCRKVFLSGNRRRLYCSDQCRQAEEKARQRNRGQNSG